MQVATATVRNDQIVVEGLELPDGTVVMLVTPRESEPVRLPPVLAAELADAIKNADLEDDGRGRGSSTARANTAEGAALLRSQGARPS
jgi:hypothetical protein